jgi:hypothetical protein
MRGPLAVVPQLTGTKIDAGATPLVDWRGSLDEIREPRRRRSALALIATFVACMCHAR